MIFNCVKKCAAVLVFGLLFFSCSQEEFEYCNTTIQNKSNINVVMTDGINRFSAPANETVNVVLIKYVGQSTPMLSIVPENYPRVKSSFTYIDWRYKTYIIEPSDYALFTVINTGNYPIKIAGNYLGENYGDTVTVEKQTSKDIKFYNGDSSFVATYDDPSVSKATPFVNKNGNVITVF